MACAEAVPARSGETAVKRGSIEESGGGGKVG